MVGGKYRGPAHSHCALIYTGLECIRVILIAVEIAQVARGVVKDYASSILKIEIQN